MLWVDSSVGYLLFGLTFELTGPLRQAPQRVRLNKGLSMPSRNGSAIPGRQTRWKRIYCKSAKLYMFVAQPWLKGTLQLAAVGDDEDVLSRDNFEQVAVNELFGKYFDTKFFFELSLNTGFWVFTNFDSAARKFPFTSVVHCEDSLVVIDEQNTFD